jgi:hypothetical protein
MQKPYLNFYTMPKVPPSKEFAKKTQGPPPPPSIHMEFQLLCILHANSHSTDSNANAFVSGNNGTSFNNYFTLNLLLIKIVLLYFSKFHRRTEKRKN